MFPLSKDNKTAVVSQLKAAIEAINASDLNAAEISTIEGLNRIYFLKEGGR
jgi:hypothetical protein